MTGLDDYKKASDSVNLSELKGEPFTIVGLEDSDYTEAGKEPSPGVKITTVETWTRAKDGVEVNKIHTTRTAVVSKLSDVKLREDVAGGLKLKVKCPEEKIKPKNGGQPYFDLVDAS